jgi:hypothetical protein
LKVTLPVGVPPLPVTVACRGTELPEPEVKAVFEVGPVEAGVNVVVLGVDADANVTLMFQDEKVMSAVKPFGSAARYSVQVPFTESPPKTDAKVGADPNGPPFVAASEIVPVSPALL